MRADSPLERRLRGRLDELREDALLRTMRPPSGIDLSSNDYLGLAAHPHIVDAFVAGAQRDGCGSTGSRLLRGDRSAFAAVERRFAQFKGTERALLFSSGYLANLAVLTTLADAGDVIFSDERNHASVVDGARLSRARTIVVPHRDLDSLVTAMDSTDLPGTAFVV